METRPELALLKSKIDELRERGGRITCTDAGSKTYAPANKPWGNARSIIRVYGPTGEKTEHDLVVTGHWGLIRLLKEELIQKEQKIAEDRLLTHVVQALHH